MSHSNNEAKAESHDPSNSRHNHGHDQSLFDLTPESKYSPEQLKQLKSCHERLLALKKQKIDELGQREIMNATLKQQFGTDDYTWDYFYKLEVAGVEKRYERLISNVNADIVLIKGGVNWLDVDDSFFEK